MKKYALTLLAAFAIAGTSFAGEAVMSKEYKQPVVTPCFRDTEFALDLFYTYSDAIHRSISRDALTNGDITATPEFDHNGDLVINASDHKRYFRDGSGGGVGFDYFFARYFGVSVEGNWWVGANTNTFRGVVIPNPAGGVTVIGGNGQTAGVGVVNPNGSVTVRTVSIPGQSSSNFHDVTNQVTGSLILRYPFEGQVCWAPYVLGGGGGVWDGRSTGFGHLGLGAEYRITPNIGVFADWRWEWMCNRNDVNMTRAGVRFVF